MRSLYKILHTSCHTQWTSVAKRIFNECVWMDKAGHKIIIAAPRESPLYLKAKDHGFKVYGIEFRWFSLKKDYRFLRHLFSNEKPDIINTHGNQDQRIALFAAKKADLNLRILSRHEDAVVSDSWYNRLLYKRLCHYVFTDTDTVTKHLQQVFKLSTMQIFSMPGPTVEPELPTEKDLTIDTMGRNIIRIYRLHQVKLEKQHLL